MKPKVAAWAAVAWLAATAATAQAPGPRSVESPRGGTRLGLGQGQTRPVPGTDLTVTLVSVSDAGSRGCLGGPVGCPKRAALTIASGAETRDVVVGSRGRAGPRRGVVAFGYRFFLLDANGDTVTLRVERAEAAVAP